MSTTEGKEVYNLLMLIAGFSEIKRRIIIVLAHLYPRAVSVAQLTDLVGYSSSSGRLYRGILDSLRKDQLVCIDHLTPRLYSVRLNYDYPLIKTLIALCQQNGNVLRHELEGVLEQNKGGVE